MNSIVVHYKELALKGRNRPWFIKLLVRNLRAALAGLDVRTIRSVMGRIEIELGHPDPGSRAPDPGSRAPDPGSRAPDPESRAPSPAWEDVRARVRRVFGIANFSY